MSDFNIFSHLNTMGFGRGGKQSGPPDPANEQESAQIVVDAAGDGVGKLTSRILGMNLSQAGQVGVNQPLEYKGWADSTIPALVDRLNSNGGIIAQIAATLVKNGVIQDQSQLHDTMMGGSAAQGGDQLLTDSGTGDLPSPLPASAPAPINDDRGGGMGA